MYEPQTTRTRWVRDQIIGALREHRELSTTQLATAIGFMPWPVGENEMTCDECKRRHNGIVKRRITSAHLQPTMTSMERHDEIVRWRPETDALWRWSLGDDAPAPVDLSEIEALL